MGMQSEPIIGAVQASLPPGAELVYGSGSPARPLALAADLDGDGIPELAAAYRQGGKLFLIVLKMGLSGWRAAAIVPGLGYEVDAFLVAPVVSRYPGSLIVGWRVGAAWSKLSVYVWTPNGLVDAAPADLAYSRLEVGDFPGAAEFAGKAEIAVWTHDTGEAYRVEVLRWVQGKLVPAPDTYPHYFERVAAYYAALLRRQPNVRMYWFYYADALAKAGRLDEAARAAERAAAINAPYPDQAALEALRRRIAAALAAREAMCARAAEGSPAAGGDDGGRLFPAPMKAVGGDRWGYIDERGAWRIRPAYGTAGSFSESGVAVVSVDGKYGAIDRSGRFVIQPTYEWIDSFEEGRAIAYGDGGARVIDNAGRVLTDRAYPFIAKYSDGRALFSDAGGLYGYLDLNGNEAIPARFRNGGDFSDGEAIVQTGEREHARIDRDGRVLTTYPYAYVGGQPSDGLLPFRREDSGPLGYIDKSGRVVIEPRFASAQPFRDGRAVVAPEDGDAPSYGGPYGLIDKTGAFVVEPKVDAILQLGQRRVALGKAIDPEQPFIGMLYAIADDRDGKLLTDHRFYQVGEYRDGMASVSDADQTYLVGVSGRPVPGLPRFDGSGSLEAEGDMVRALVDQRTSYYNRRLGALVFAQGTTIPLTAALSVQEKKYKPNRDYLVYYPQLEGMADKGAQERVNARLRELSGVVPVPEGQLDSSYSGDFEVSMFRDALLVLQLNAYDYPWGAAHGMASLAYAHLNVENGSFYELKDLFKPGSDYVKKLSGIVGEMIRTDPQYDYVFPDSYKGVKPDQPFFVTGDALHLYFEPYEIGPYAAGFPTFRIPFADIMDLIDTNGEFWRSFHRQG